MNLAVCLVEKYFEFASGINILLGANFAHANDELFYPINLCKCVSVDRIAKLVCVDYRVGLQHYCGFLFRVSLYRCQWRNLLPEFFSDVGHDRMRHTQYAFQYVQQHRASAYLLRFA